MRINAEHRPARAFSLLEMLAAVGVLALLVVLIAQALDVVTKLVSNVEKRSTVETESRSLFSQIGTDLRQAVMRRDLDFSTFKHDAFTSPAEFGGADIAADLQTGDDRLAFYSLAPGVKVGSIAESKRSSFSVVGYSMGLNAGVPRLLRAAQNLAWEAESGVGALAYLPVTISRAFPNLFSDPILSSAAAENVFRFEVSYLLRSRLPSESPFAITPWSNHLDVEKRWPNGLSDVYAIVVTIAVLDERSRQIAGDLSSVAALLPDANDAEDPAPVWREIVSRADFATRSSLPPAAASAVRVDQHTFPVALP